jgi:hypothetical protein
MEPKIENQFETRWIPHETFASLLCTPKGYTNIINHHGRDETTYINGLSGVANSKLETVDRHGGVKSLDR